MAEEFSGFDGVIRASVNEAGVKKKSGHIDPRMIDPSKQYPCPVCGSKFFLEKDVTAHIEGTSVPDPGFRKDDAVVNTGDNRMSGVVRAIEPDHRVVYILVDGTTEPRKFYIRGGREGNSRVFWVKRGVS